MLTSDRGSPSPFHKVLGVPWLSPNLKHVSTSLGSGLSGYTNQNLIPITGSALTLPPALVFPSMLQETQIHDLCPACGWLVQALLRCSSSFSETPAACPMLRPVGQYPCPRHGVNLIEIYSNPQLLSPATANPNSPGLSCCNWLLRPKYRNLPLFQSGLTVRPFPREFAF